MIISAVAIGSHQQTPCTEPSCSKIWLAIALATELITPTRIWWGENQSHRNDNVIFLCTNLWSRKSKTVLEWGNVWYKCLLFYNSFQASFLGISLNNSIIIYWRNTLLRGVKLIFTRGHSNLAVAFKGMNVVLGLYKCNYPLAVKQELSIASG